MIRVAFIVNAPPDSAMGQRARSFTTLLRDGFDIEIAYRRGRIVSVIAFLGFLIRWRPRISYVFDMAYAGVAAGVVYRLLARNRLIIDTGDVISELARSMGRGRPGLALTRALEQVSLRVADAIVVRGTLHRELLHERGVRAEVIQDGVVTDQFHPHDESELRERYGLDGFLTIGVLGSSVWSPRLETCYGWELVETIRLLRDEPVKGMVIGDGTGIPRLQALATRYGIADRVIFVGRLPYDELPRYLQIMDVCLSTQTDDVVGRVRTTGKLPLYLAAGRYVLASRVGEAALVLDEEMLVDYDGAVDPTYPEKLADRIRPLLRRRDLLRHGARGVTLARRHFDYAVLAPRLRSLLHGTLADAPPAGSR